MPTIRCSKCKKMFTVDGLPPEACGDCMARKAAMLAQVRELVKANPGISPQVVSKQTGVPVPVIVRYISSEM